MKKIEIISFRGRWEELPVSELSVTPVCFPPQLFCFFKSSCCYRKCEGCFQLIWQQKKNQRPPASVPTCPLLPPVPRHGTPVPTTGSPRRRFKRLFLGNKRPVPLLRRFAVNRSRRELLARTVMIPARRWRRPSPVCVRLSGPRRRRTGSWKVLCSRCWRPSPTRGVDWTSDRRSADWVSRSGSLYCGPETVQRHLGDPAGSHPAFRPDSVKVLMQLNASTVRNTQTPTILQPDTVKTQSVKLIDKSISWLAENQSATANSFFFYSF